MNNKFEEYYKNALLAKKSKDKVEILDLIFSEFSLDMILNESNLLFDKNYEVNYKNYKPKFTKFLKNKSNNKLIYKHILSEFIQKIPFVSSVIYRNNIYKGLRMYENKFKTWHEEDSYNNKRETVIKDIVDNWDKYKAVINDLLDEEKSKLIYCDVLFARIFKDYEFYYNHYSDSELQYFDTELVKFNKNEVILECGGYDGLTITELKSFYDEFDKLVVFEPVSLNANLIRKKFDTDKRIEVIEKGTSNKEGKLFFNQNNDMMMISNEGDLSLDVVSIDSVINYPFHYLFMDIEGSEMNTLEGTEVAIKKYTPRLAISIYHKYDDIWMIPLYIHNINPNYLFYIRHYSTDKTDTVLYAIPNT